MINAPFTGRIEETKILEKALVSQKAEMIAVIGRRRVGKTFLVKSVYKNKIDFSITGIQHAPREEQLQNFAIQLRKASPSNFVFNQPRNWLESFDLLSQLLELKLKNKKRKAVVFLDEIPWLHTHKSGFLRGLSFFWNSWAVDQNIVVVICGSAASWMIKKVVHHKGGLHNRITKRIYLKPFNLSETEQFLKAKNINLDRYHILHLYMAMGGIPYYLDEIESGDSAFQSINNICFSENGLLHDEFPKLYSSLFENSETHIEIIRTLAQKRKGLTRVEIVQSSRLSEGGGLTTALEELVHSGFISIFQSFGNKKKNTLFRLTDEYSLFYLKFIENNTSQKEGTWLQLSQSQDYISWSGYTFESICMKHLSQIKNALRIGGVHTTASTYFKKGTKDKEGVQIDLLIDRNDHVINACEMKFYNNEFTITNTIAMELRNKIARFKEMSKTPKQVFLTLVTTFGLKQNQYSSEFVDREVTMNDLFEK